MPGALVVVLVLAVTAYATLAGIAAPLHQATESLAVAADTLGIARKVDHFICWDNEKSLLVRAA